MKKIIVLLLLCSSITAQSATVWWRHSFSEDAVLHDGSRTYSIIEYAESVLGDSLYNIAYMIKDVANDSYLDFRLDGFEPDSVNWVEGVGGYDYIRIQDVAVGEVYVDSVEDWSTFNRNWNDELIAELYLYDEDNDLFTKFAYSDIFTMEDIERSLWGQGTIAPRPEVDTWFTDFYTDAPVPESSTTILTMFGLCVLLLGRKNAEQV